MLTLEFLAARHGDCCLAHWGEPSHTMLVDGGPDKVFEESLWPRLMALPSAPGKPPSLDVVCVSHVDDDHIAGVLSLLGKLRRIKGDHLPLPITIHRVWFNSLDRLMDQAHPGLSAQIQAIAKASPATAAVAASYGQGDALRSSIAALQLAGNDPFGDPVLAGQRETFDGLEVTVVGPQRKALRRLFDAWKKPKAMKAPAVVAAAFDRTVPNLSSIARCTSIAQVGRRS